MSDVKSKIMQVLIEGAAQQEKWAHGHYPIALLRNIRCAMGVNSRGRVEDRRPPQRAYRTGERGAGIQMSPREPHWSGRLASGGER